ncbi:hypothetical protein POM88_052834 [Heracleum sosnowskyi]|uniref:F-box associated beta-propeller type 3 domain-containing protein n=1 Tax=Heracleum sosnowskyi TaxID=360622 RepID=A0AAD8LXP8_9APIA|nr:hypothetical protein POM88_052834 [Heracleum sosnowskyi]
MACNLPDDMLIEIFKILPIVCILRCSKLLSLRFDDETCKKYQSLHHLPGMPEFVDFSEKKFITWYATSNGLICASTSYTIYKPEHYNSKIYVWNPTVRKYITLPDSPRSEIPVFGDYCQVKLAFAFFPESLDYKVVKIVHDTYYKNKSESTLVDVYTRSTNSWKMISQENVITPSCFDTSDGVFVDAVAFWLGGDKIVCFDSDNDIMRVIALPEITDDMSLSIRASGDSLALFVRNIDFTILTMWVLEGGLTNNEIVWKKKGNICLQVGNRWRYQELGLEALGFRNNGEVFVRRSDILISYNVEHGEIKCSANPMNLLFYDDMQFLAGENSIYPFPENLALLGCA